MRRRAVWYLMAAMVGVFLSGCGSDPEGGGPGPQKQEYAEIEAMPSQLQFSPLAAGETQTLTVTLTNTGTRELEIKHVFIADENAPFAVSDPEVVTLAPTDSTEVPVTYVATAQAPGKTSLIIDSNAATTPVLEVPITVGQAIAGLRVLPDPIDFGDVLGGSSKQLSATVENNGTAPIAIKNIFIELGSSQDFQIIDPPAYPLNVVANGSTYVDLSYTPTGQDIDSGFLVIALDNGGVQSLEKVEIRGREVGPEVSVSPPKIDFEWVPIDTFETREVHLHNMGEHDLHIDKLYLAPGTNEDISIESPPNSQVVVKPGNKYTVTVNFAPKEFFQTTMDPIGGLVVECNDADEAIVNVPVYGNIDAPFIKIDPPETVDFGIVAQGWTIERTLVIQNVGHAPLTVDLLEVSENSPAMEFAVVEDEEFAPTLPGGGEGLLEAEEQVEVLLSFTNDGAASGTQLGTLHIRSDDPITPDLYVDLSANRGGSPECKLAFVPNKLEFGTVAHGGQDTKTMFLKNVGSGYCSWKSGVIRECTSFMGMMTTCSETSGPSSEFIPQGMPIPVQDGIAPGTAHPIQVLYKPPTTVPFIPMFEDYYGVLHVTYNEPYSSGGTYTEHKMPAPDAMGSLGWNIHGKSGVADIAVLPGEVEFGLVTIGCYSQTTCVKVYNAGTAPLDVYDIFTDGCGPEFNAKNYPPLPIKIQPSQYEEVCVVYLPQNEGPDQCSLVIESSDLDTPLYKVPLKGEGTWDTEHTDYFTQISGKKVDILFVVDESASMCGEQSNLANNFNTLTTIAQQWGNDYQIGITTTNITDEEYIGKLFGQPRFLDKTNVASFSKNVKDVGCDGSGEQESGLEAGRRALTPPLATDTDVACSCADDQPCPASCAEGELCVKGKCGGYNRGFLREDAALEVVFVSDEEDQSPGSIPFYIDFFKSIKGFLNEDLFHAHAIVGDKNKGCSDPNDSSEGAGAGNRYIEVQEATGGDFGSICDTSFASVLKDIGNKAFGLKVQFFLSAQADSTPGNMKVWVDPGTGFEPCTDGWKYHPSTNSVEFLEGGPCMPQAGDEIKIWYKMVCNTE